MEKRVLVVVSILIVIFFTTGYFNKINFSPSQEILENQENIELQNKINEINKLKDPAVEKKIYIIVFREPSLLDKRKEILNGISPRISLNVKESNRELSLTQKKVYQDSIILEKTKLKQVQSQNILNIESKGIKIQREFITLVNGVQAELTEIQLKEIRKDQSVKQVYEEIKLEPLLTNSTSQIRATNVWDIQDIFGKNITGKNVTIAIIDTGVDYTHPDFGGCLGPNCKVFDGYDSIDMDNDPMPIPELYAGHGTHVASIAAGNGSSLGGLNGVAPDALIYALRGPSGQTELELLVDLNKNGIPFEDDSDVIDIISISQGGSGGILLADDIIDPYIPLIEMGVVIVIAAGNCGPASGLTSSSCPNKGNASITSPGYFESVITVGSSRSDGLQVYGSSSRGPVFSDTEVLIKPDVIAPGASICAAQFDYPELDTCLDDNHVLNTGTSMATPFVSGLAALILQAHPEYTPEMVKASIMSGAINIGSDATDQGTGRIDALNAVNPYNNRSIILDGTLEYDYISFDNPTKKVVNITIFNPANYTKNYTLSTDLVVSRVTLEFPQNVTVLSNSSKILNINLTTLAGTQKGMYEGKLFLTGPETFSVPLIFYSATIFNANITYNPNGFQKLEFLALDSSSKIVEYYKDIIFDSSGLKQLGVNNILNSSKNYDFLLIYQQDILINNITNKFDRNNTILFLENINISINQSITLDTNDFGKKVKYFPVMPNGTYFKNHSSFKSFVGMSLKNGYIIDIKMDSFLHDANLFINVLPQGYLLDYFSYLKIGQDFYTTTNRLTSVNSSINISNSPSDFLQKEVNMPILSESFNDSSIVSPTVDFLYSYDGGASYLTVGVKGPPLGFKNIYNYTEAVNISTQIPMNIYMTPKISNDFLYKSFSLGFLDPSDFTSNLTGVVKLKDPYLMIGYISNISQNGIVFWAKPDNSVSSNGPLTQYREILSNSTDLGLSPLFLTNRHFSLNDRVNFETYVLSQSGDFGLSNYHVFTLSTLYKGAVPKISMFSYNPGLHHVVPYGDSLKAFPNAASINYSTPSLVKNTLITLYTNAYDPLPSSSFYFDASLPDKNPPILIDVDLLENEKLSSKVSSSNGKLRFTIADENLNNVEVKIDNQSIIPSTVGSPYTVQVPAVTFDEQQSNYFEVNFTSLNLSVKSDYQVDINASDLSGNWFLSTFYIKIQEQFTVNLTKGINFVNIPLLLINKDPDQLNSEYVLTYDSINSTWLVNHGGVKQISTLDPGRAYIVKSNSDQSSTLFGVNSPISYSLQPGWNLVNFQTDDSVTGFYGPGNYSVYELNKDNVTKINGTNLLSGRAYWIFPGDSQLSPPPNLFRSFFR